MSPSIFHQLKRKWQVAKNRVIAFHSRPTPNALQSWGQITSIICGIVSIPLTCIAIWITIDLAEKDETVNKLSFLIEKVIEQNEKLDKEIKTQALELDELIKTAKNTDLFNKYMLSHLTLTQMNSQPKIIVKNIHYKDNLVFTQLANVGERPANNIKITTYLFLNGSNGYERAINREENNIAHIASKGDGAIISYGSKDKEIIFIKYSLSYKDPVSAKRIKDSFYITPKVDSLYKENLSYPISVQLTQYFENQLLQHSPKE